jgi:hypothetical protein
MQGNSELKTQNKGPGCSSVVEHLFSVQKALDLNLTPSKNTLKIRTVVPFVKQRE